MENATQQIDNYIAELNDWQQKTFKDIRRLIREAEPHITEEWKWRDTPVWSHNGDVCLAKAFKDTIKITFPFGAKLPDPEHLFNNGLEGNAWRAIDLYENDKLDEKAFKTLVRAGVEFSMNKAKKPMGKIRDKAGL